jgi:hypothetical protein
LNFIGGADKIPTPHKDYPVMPAHELNRFLEAVGIPKLIPTGEPLESDAYFRERILRICVWTAAIALRDGRELDAIGWLYGMVRRGYRVDAADEGAPPRKEVSPDDKQDAKRWREFCRLAAFDRVGFNRPEEEGFTVRIKVPVDWDLSFTEAIDASIARNGRPMSSLEGVIYPDPQQAHDTLVRKDRR